MKMDFPISINLHWIWGFLILNSLSNHYIIDAIKIRTSEVGRLCGTSEYSPLTNFIPNFIVAMDNVQIELSIENWGVSNITEPNPPVFAFAQCFGDLPPPDCRSCFAVARMKLPNCLPSVAARLYLDGCYIRYDNHSFIHETIDEKHDKIACGPPTDFSNDELMKSEFARKVKEVLAILTQKAVNKGGYAVDEDRGGVEGVFGLAQCWKTLSKDECRNCLVNASASLLNCAPASEGRAMFAGCYVRYSTDRFFHLAQRQQEEDEGSPLHDLLASNRVWIIIAGIFSAIVLGLLALFGVYVGVYCGYKSKKNKVIHEDVSITIKKSNLNFKGYMAPEYLVRGQLTEKADVYAFGVLVLEIACGRKNSAFTLGSGSILHSVWKCYKEKKISESIDPGLKSDFPIEEASNVLQIGLLCTQASVALRPSMSDVVKMLTDEEYGIPSPKQPPFLNASLLNSDETRMISEETSSSYTENSSNLYDSIVETTESRTVRCGILFVNKTKSTFDFELRFLVVPLWSGTSLRFSANELRERMLRKKIASESETTTVQQCVVDIITAMGFDASGDYLAVGDRGGRVVIFERKDGKHTSNQYQPRTKLEKLDFTPTWNPEFQYKTEFQSHEPEFDYLKSLEIEEKINKVRWCATPNGSLFILSTNNKTIKLWKVKERKIVDMEDTAQTRCRKAYAHAHEFNINSISTNSDCETFISADDLRINLWNLEISGQCFNIIDMKPSNMEDLTEVITIAEFHPIHCNFLAYGSSRGFIRLVDMRQSALCDHSAIILEDGGSRGSKSFFTEIVASISDMKFSKDGRYILSRDYMNLKFILKAYRLNMHANISLLLSPDINFWQLCELYDNDCIFDKFACCLSGDGMHYATGSYSNHLRIFSHGAGSDEGITIEASKHPVRKPVLDAAPRTRRSSLSNLTRGFYRHGNDNSSSGNDFSCNLNSKLLHLAWHPEKNLIACAAGNSLFMYHA
ncbi:hypothetical protein G4B88_018323 [Cannabis sativa]|uniref:Gnk2-homologous domain-containing protein n=1 Tax=Cannabis sativa TaxID=3483 RepID=A0A7J6EWH2_CANSA|nr:hypothetical protein G4B88_018323 [Cannabis sativa]